MDGDGVGGDSVFAHASADEEYTVDMLHHLQLGADTSTPISFTPVPSPYSDSWMEEAEEVAVLPPPLGTQVTITTDAAASTRHPLTNIGNAMEGTPAPTRAQLVLEQEYEYDELPIHTAQRTVFTESERGCKYFMTIFVNAMSPDVFNTFADELHAVLNYKIPQKGSMIAYETMKSGKRPHVHILTHQSSSRQHGRDRAQSRLNYIMANIRHILHVQHGGPRPWCKIVHGGVQNLASYMSKRKNNSYIRRYGDFQRENDDVCVDGKEGFIKAYIMAHDIARAKLVRFEGDDELDADQQEEYKTILDDVTPPFQPVTLDYFMDLGKLVQHRIFVEYVSEQYRLTWGKDKYTMCPFSVLEEAAAKDSYMRYRFDTVTAKRAMVAVKSQFDVFRKTSRCFQNPTGNKEYLLHLCYQDVAVQRQLILAIRPRCLHGRTAVTRALYLVGDSGIGKSLLIAPFNEDIICGRLHLQHSTCGILDTVVGKLACVVDELAANNKEILGKFRAEIFSLCDGAGFTYKTNGSTTNFTEPVHVMFTANHFVMAADTTDADALSRRLLCYTPRRYAGLQHNTPLARRHIRNWLSHAYKCNFGGPRNYPQTEVFQECVEEALRSNAMVGREEYIKGKDLIYPCICGLFREPCKFSFMFPVQCAEFDFAQRQYDDNGSFVISGYDDLHGTEYFDRC